MRKFKLKNWVVAGVVCALPYAPVVDAAGLGKLNVLSQLGQPFNAEIDLVNVSRDEAATLKAALAPPSAYQAANLQFNNALTSLRMTIEQRANGASYIRAISSRPVSEPFLDLMIELSWQGGRVVREYSALLDPPGITPPAAATTAAPPVAAAADTPAAAPAPRPARAPESADSSRPASAPASAARVAPSQMPGQYTVREGDNLTGIARQYGLEGVSLEQMLIGLYRANPDAFFGSNINNLRAGKILNIPEREQLLAIGQGEAQREVRVHATNWYAYRRRAADLAAAASDTSSAAKGRITSRTEDGAAGAAPKDVVVLSKGDAVTGGAGAKGTADRVRALEEDLAARDKALAESKERIAQLEKTLKDMQKLAQLKNPQLAAAQDAAKAADSKAGEKATEATPPAKPEPVQADPTKSEAVQAEPAKVEPPKPETKAAASKPPVQKKIITPAPPRPEPGFMDTVMENLVPIGGGIAALLAGIAGFLALRRRKQGGADEQPEPPIFSSEPHKSPATVARVPAAAAVAAPVVEPTVANVTDIVDPIDEAQVYIDHGRDSQAEEILRDAMVKQPAREDVQLKLLEVLAARGDKAAFNTVAEGFHKLTSGVGDNWKRAIALGYALDPTNPLYPSTGDVVDLPVHREDSTNVDLDLGGAPSKPDALANTTAILLDQGDSGLNMEKTMVLTRDAFKSSGAPGTPPTSAAAPEPSVPEFNLDLPPAGKPAATTDSAAGGGAGADGNVVEFNIDLPPAATPEAEKPAAAKDGKDGGLDFKVDFSDINLNLDDKPATADASAAAPAGAVKDAHWEDVQQKFDLARAYQEMGDKEGALEILREVEREGDTGQKSEAQKMIKSLS